MAESIGELSRDEFITAMISHLRETIKQNPPPLEPAACFRELCYDFPAVGAEEIETVNQTIAQILDYLDDQGTKEAFSTEKVIPSWFSLSPKFTSGIQECFLKVESKGQDNSRFKEALSLLYSNVYLKLFERALRDDSACSKLLKDAGHKNSDSLASVFGNVSYHFISNLSPQSWEREHITATVYRIIRLLTVEPNKDIFEDMISESSIKLMTCWPQYLFLLRDRMVSHPETIPKLLPAVVDIIEQVDGDSEHSSSFIATDACAKEPNSILLGTLAVLIENSNVKQASKSDLEFLWNFIWKLLPALVVKLNNLVAVHDDSKSKDSMTQAELRSLILVFEFLSCGDPKKPFTAAAASEKLFGVGIIRAVTNSWIQQTNSSNEIMGKFLLSCCCRSKNISEYVSKIRNLPDKVSRLPAVECLLWHIILSIQVKEYDEINLLSRMQEFLSFEYQTGNLRSCVYFLDVISKRYIVRLLLQWKHNSELIRLLKELRKELAKTPSINEDAKDDPLAEHDRKQRVCKLIKRSIGRLSNNGSPKCD